MTSLLGTLPRFIKALCSFRELKSHQNCQWDPKPQAQSTSFGYICTVSKETSIVLSLRIWDEFNQSFDIVDRKKKGDLGLRCLDLKHLTVLSLVCKFPVGSLSYFVTLYSVKMKFTPSQVVLKALFSAAYSSLTSQQQRHQQLNEGIFKRTFWVKLCGL